MDLVHYSEGIPSAMHCGYFVLVKMLLCRHYPMLKGLCFSGVSQDLAISQTGYLTRKCSEKDFTAHMQSVWIRHQRAPQLIILLVMNLWHTIWQQESRWSQLVKSRVCRQVWQRLHLRLCCAAAFSICLSCYNYMINLMCRTLLYRNVSLEAIF